MWQDKGLSFLSLFVHRVQGQDGRVSYNDLVQQLNWRDSPIAPLQYQPIAQDESWAGNKDKNCVSRISYQPLLDDLLGKAKNA